MSTNMLKIMLGREKIRKTKMLHGPTAHFVRVDVDVFTLPKSPCPCPQSNNQFTINYVNGDSDIVRKNGSRTPLSHFTVHLIFSMIHKIGITGFSKFTSNKI